MLVNVLILLGGIFATLLVTAVVIKLVWRHPRLRQIASPFQRLAQRRGGDYSHPVTGYPRTVISDGATTLRVELMIAGMYAFPTATLISLLDVDQGGSEAPLLDIKPTTQLETLPLSRTAREAVIRLRELGGRDTTRILVRPSGSRRQRRMASVHFQSWSPDKSDYDECLDAMIDELKRFVTAMAEPAELSDGPPDRRVNKVR